MNVLRKKEKKDMFLCAMAWLVSVCLCRSDPASLWRRHFSDLTVTWAESESLLWQKQEKIRSLTDWLTAPHVPQSVLRDLSWQTVIHTLCGHLSLKCVTSFHFISGKMYHLVWETRQMVFFRCGLNPGQLQMRNQTDSSCTRLCDSVPVCSL